MGKKATIEKLMVDEVKVVQSPDGETITKEVLAESILEIAKGIKAIRLSGLRQNDLEIPVARRMKYEKSTVTVRKVMEAINQLVRDYHLSP